MSTITISCPGCGEDLEIEHGANGYYQRATFNYPEEGEYPECNIPESCATCKLPLASREDFVEAVQQAAWEDQRESALAAWEDAQEGDR